MKLHKSLMKNILWNFDEKKIEDFQQFLKALEEYNKSINQQDFSFDENTIVLKSAKVVIQYHYWSNEKNDTIEPDFVLNADNGISFKQGELLFKVHNEVCEKLKNEDHSFFEGFRLWEGENPNHPDIPLYFVLQGS